MYRDNALLKRLRDGQSCIGGWLALGNAMAAEVMSLAGFDALVIDHEHGAGTLTDATAQMQAAAAAGPTLIVRVPSHDHDYIKRVLDAGAEGVMVPAVETVAQAEAIAAACRYPPKGRRGAAFTLARAADYGARGEDYARTIGDNLLVICQIESEAAVAQAQAIGAVDGIDMLFVGPLDLSGNVGRLGQFDDAVVRDAVARAEAAIKTSGTWLGGIDPEPGGGRRLLERGYDFAVVAADALLIRDGAAAAISQSRYQD